MQMLVRAIAIATALMLSAGVSKATERYFDIPQQALSEALVKLSEQADTLIMAPQELVQGKNAPGVRGMMSVKEALDKLLQGSGLKAEEGEKGGITILEASNRENLAEPVNNRNDAMVRRIVQADESSSAGHAPERVKTVADSSKPSEIQEIVVTAQKRAENLQNVPISIAVLSGDDLDRSTVQGVTEALRRVPGVSTIVSGAGGGTSVVVRGVTSARRFGGGSSPVAYYLDSAPFGFVRSGVGPDANVYDLERVEVLRGPQGTLYGANSAGGVVRILTKQVDFDRFELKARTAASLTEKGGDTYRGDAAINVPLVEGKLAARAVLSYQDLGGWIDRVSLSKPDANDAQIRTLRLKLGAQPTERLSLDASMWLSRSKQDENINSFDGYVNTSLFHEAAFTDYDVFAARIAYDFSAFTLTGSSSYLDYSNEFDLDSTPLAGVRPGHSTYDNRNFTQEVYFNSTHDGPWRWTAGGIYRNSRDRQSSFTPISSPLLRAWSDDSESFALFGELTRVLLDGRLEVTAGLRHFEDELSVIEHDRGTAAPYVPVRRSRKFDADTPRLVLAWHPRKQMTVYASYAEGFRSGLEQSPALIASRPDFPSAQPDILKNYEVGAKSSAWNGALMFDAALFYVDWPNIQQVLVVPYQGNFVSALVNGQGASGIGAELGFTIRPIERLELTFNVGWNDLNFDEDVFSGPDLLFGKGDRLNFSPEYTGNGVVEYGFPLGDRGFRGRLSAGAQFTSSQDERLLLGGLRIGRSDNLLIGRANFAIDAPSGWGATFFIDNLNDERGADVRAAASFALINQMGRVRPRTFGMQLDYSF